MKKLHIFMTKTFIGPFLLTFFISVFILVMQFFWKYVDELVGKGIDLGVFMELISYVAVNTIPMALPLAILLSSIMTFGTLGEHFELVALKSSGVSLLRIMFPLIIVMLLISTSAFFFSNFILPQVNIKFFSLLHDVRTQRPEISLKEGIFYNEIDDYSIRIESKNEKTNMLYGLMIYDHTQRQGNASLVVADSGKLTVTPDKNFLIIQLYDGTKYQEIVPDLNTPKANRSFPHQTDHFQSENITIDLEGFQFNRSDESLFQDNYQMLNSWELEYTIDSLQEIYENRADTFQMQLVKGGFYKVQGPPDSLQTSPAIPPNPDSLLASRTEAEKKEIATLALTYARSQKSFIEFTAEELRVKKVWIRKHEIQYHLKFTLSIACLILFFVGAPLGAIIRRGGLGMPVVASVLLFILYYIISLSGEKFAKEDILPAWAGIWLSSAVLLPLGLFLTYKAATDSSILNVDLYLEPFRKLHRLIKKSGGKAKPVAENENSPGPQ